MKATEEDDLGEDAAVMFGALRSLVASSPRELVDTPRDRIRRDADALHTAVPSRGAESGRVQMNARVIPAARDQAKAMAGEDRITVGELVERLLAKEWARRQRGRARRGKR